jgi:hypothetical protein
VVAVPYLQPQVSTYAACDNGKSAISRTKESLDNEKWTNIFEQGLYKNISWFSNDTHQLIY